MPRPSSARPERALSIAVHTPDRGAADVEASLAELERLAAGLGIRVVHRVVQRRPTANEPSLLGAGKLRELAALTGGPGEVAAGPAPADTPAAAGEVDLVLVDHELSPGQERHLRLALGVEVVDRTSLILRVFEQRARTPEARLQVEIARLLYETPRVRDDRSLGDREGGGGRASRGHSNVELAKQRNRARVAALRRELEGVEAARAQRTARRRDAPRVALVGYTNAGKSSLMRGLTGADAVVDDRPFVTLGTTVRALRPETTPRILVTDTVGFIDRLPHALVASFRSTLEEVRDASLLLFVVDAADPAWRRQLAVTRGVVDELGASSIPAIVVLNKIDRVPDRAALVSEMPDALAMSAHDRADVRALHARIAASLNT